MRLFSIILLFITIIIFSESTYSQIVRRPEKIQKEEDNPFELNYGLKLDTRYIWRGLDLANSPAIVPFGTINYVGLNFGIIGVYALNEAVPKNKDFLLSNTIQVAYNKIELHLGYSIPSKVGTFSTNIVDYLFPYSRIRYLDSLDHIRYKSPDYLDFQGGGTGTHNLEVNVSYEGPEVFPIRLFYAYNFLNDVDYSWYVEAGYKFRITTEHFDVFIGGTKGPSAWYGIIKSDGSPSKDYGVINAGFGWNKVFPIDNTFSLPIGFRFIYNAFNENNYVVLSLGLNIHG